MMMTGTHYSKGLADIKKLNNLVGYEPKVDFKEGIKFFIDGNLIYSDPNSYKPIGSQVENETPRYGNIGNGSEMTSEDFVASMNRWGNHSAKGKNVFEYVEKVVAAGTYGVAIVMSEPFSPILTYLARSRHACIIVPAEIARKYEASPIKRTDYIGTGPYKFNEWAPGDYISICLLYTSPSPRDRTRSRKPSYA